MSQPLVTVYFLTYNRPHLFPIGLRSIQNQTFRNFKVLVIDNGSTPPITLPDDIACDPRFEVVRIDDNAQGRAVSLNILKNIDTPYTAYLFDDDRWTPGKLEKQVALLESKPDVVACFTHAQLINTEEDPIPESKGYNPFNVPNRSRGAWAQQFFFRGNCLCQPSLVARANVLAEAFSPMPYVQLPDLAQWVNLLAFGDIEIIEEPLTLFCWASDGSNESAINDRASANRLTYEYSRIYHQFRQLPDSVLCEAFALPPDAPRRTIETALFNGAVSCNDEAHFRFAAELSEELFKTTYLNGEISAAADWGRNFKIGASQTPSPDKQLPGQFLPKSNGDYQSWLNARAQNAASSQFPDLSVAGPMPVFHILLRLLAGQEELLANTIDSLAQQTYPNWHLDIFSNLISPDGLADVPCIGWHAIADVTKSKGTINATVNSRYFDWILDLPPGAVVDPLYFWRLTHEINTQQGSVFFVDDDCYSNTNERLSPRFKPGVNPTALQSADLAGPICVHRDLWQSTGGASQRLGSPWFEKLFAVAKVSGWASIKHIPDVLISYPEKFPTDIESCLLSLTEDLKAQGIEGEIIPVSGLSWTTRYSPATHPSVTVAILSTGQLDLLSRCFKSVIEKTDYPNFEIIIALTYLQRAPDLDTWLNNVEQTNKPKIRIVRTELDGNHVTRCNAAAMASSSDFLLFLKEETVVIQEKWLEELVRSGAQPGIGGVAPRMIQPGSAMIENAGSVLGLNGVVGSPYQGKTKLGEDLGYLDSIHVARDVSTLPAACMLIRKESYLKSGGMDEVDLGSHLAEIDLCLKLRRNGERLIYQPLSNIVSSDPKEAKFDLDPTHVASEILSETHARQVFFERWYPAAAVDPFWNPALSLATNIPTPELEFQARWQTIPSDLPRILAHPLPNGQGDYRVTSPLTALSKAGLASECIWRQRTKGEPRFHSIAEIVRLNPDSVIVQHYTITPALAALQEWSASGCRPFTVYALDDLITDMDATNPFRKDIPANARTRLQYALQRCDRLVVSTDYLADAYSGFIPDIRVVPNRLEQAHWLPLRSHRRTTKKPRIGWAGGTTHQGDLLLLKEIVEQTRDEADWIFFGMCPDEIRPLLAEYHGLVSFSEYPAYLASLNLDLAVAPLSQTAFNRGKSNLRLLDYGILGIPVVCTDIEPYRNSPACCVNNTVAEWTGAIRARIHDPEAREREGDAIRRWVLDGYLLENHLEQWLKAHLPD